MGARRRLPEFETAHVRCPAKTGSLGERHLALVFLADRAEGAAPAADCDAAKRLSADRARLACMSVDPQKRSVPIALPLGCEILLRRDFVLLDKV